MKYLKVKHYISVLPREGTRWEYKDILEKKDEETSAEDIKRLSRRKRLIILLISAGLCYFLATGFNREYVGYVAASLSIFIGLFTNIIIVLYQRMQTIPVITNKTSDDDRVNIIKNKNFIKQFTFVTGKSILVATLLIILLTFTLLFKNFFLTDISSFTAIEHFSDTNLSNLFNFLIFIFLIFYRLFSVYLLIDFFLLLLYSLGALFGFLKGEYSSN